LNAAFPHGICKVHSLERLIPTTFINIPSIHINTTEESKGTGKFICMQTIKAYGCRHSCTHSKLQFKMKVSHQLHTLATLTLATHSTGNLVGSRAGMNVLEKKKLSCPCQEVNHISSVVQPVV